MGALPPGMTAPISRLLTSMCLAVGASSGSISCNTERRRSLLSPDSDQGCTGLVRVYGRPQPTSRHCLEEETGESYESSDFAVLAGLYTQHNWIRVG
jgi:hypothetical protein